ncbi:MAG TPA: hypothetical protein VE153_38040 [Myxococcus sp.]|nr:hypothetical protein [Myxococcus sp.]
MGWTINYRVECERGWSEDDKRKLRAHVSKWNEALSARSGGYNVGGMVAGSPFHGFTRPVPSARAAGDYVTIVQALRELETLFPETRVYVSDTGGIVRESRPGDIDLDRLHEQMLEEWGSDADMLEGEEPEDPEEAEAYDDEEDEEYAGPEEPEPQSPEAALVAPLLERARKDFEIWKRAQKKE